MIPLFNWDDYEEITLEEFANCDKDKAWILTNNVEVKTICLREKRE